jgi:hypothetical protein
MTTKTKTKSKSNKTWKNVEDIQLLINIKNNDISSVAKMHNRTDGSIKIRLKYLSNKMHSEGKTINEIMFATKLSEDIITRQIEKNTIHDDEETQQILKSVKNLIVKIKNRNSTYKQKQFNNSGTKQLKQIKKMLTTVLKNQEELIEYFDANMREIK